MVIGPPESICRNSVGTTLPRLPSTLPKRTADRTVSLGADLADGDGDQLGDAFGQAHEAGRV